MKNFILSLYMLCLSVICLLTGCEGMDATYKEFLGDGPIIYIGKVDSAKVFPGRERVQITWQKQNDPRAKTAKIYWNNNEKFVDIVLNPANSTSVFIDDLEQGSYVFNIYTYDSHGNKSVKVETVGNVYGERYESALQNRRLKDVKESAGKMIITFDAVVDPTLVETEITYPLSGGGEKTVVLNSSENTVSIDDYASKTFRYRSGYLPETSAIDKFYSVSDDYPEP